MEHSTKLILNTAASYARIIINTVVTLISTNIALRCLGVEDFGLYNLIAGVITMLGFVNGSLMISSQRFFSIAIGKKNNELLNKYFNSSIGIHIIVALLVVLFLIIFRFFLFDDFLSINPSRINAAVRIYDIMIISSIVTVATIPLSAIMNAKEDMVILSFSDIISCLFKLLAAVILLYISSDKLITYTIMMLLAILVKAFIEYIWCDKKYKELKISFHDLFRKEEGKNMIGFVGWNTLGSLAVLVRNQGVAVVLNIFFGTVVNAAYGIANQVNSLVLSFASTLTTVFTPMIIQAKGEGNEEKMLRTAILSSKLSFLLSSMMALPLMIFLYEILGLWLGQVPENTLVFCKYIILSFLVLQLYPGLNRAIYATGKIKGYQICISISLLMILPVGYILFKYSYPAYSILLVMLLSQVLTLLFTVHYAKKFCNLSVMTFLTQSVFMPVVTFGIFYFIGHIATEAVPYHINIFHIIIFSIIICLLYCLCYFFTILNSYERSLFYNILKKIKR